MEDFTGYHSEWNLGSPGGWDYQRVTQELGKAVWKRVNEVRPVGVELDFDHPYMSPVIEFSERLLAAHRERSGSNPGLIAVVAEEETLEDVTENANLAARLDNMDGVSGALMAPHWLELDNGRVSYKGQPVSVIFMDFNTDVLLRLHRKMNLSPLLQAVREGRVINPRGTEPINVKSMFEVLTGPLKGRFSEEIVRRTPWTRRFFARSTDGPAGEEIKDLIEWTRANWDDLVLKPERGYSGMGVKVGGVNPDADEAVKLALEKGDYIVQSKVPLDKWAEDLPELTEDKSKIRIRRYQTDFRCFIGQEGLMGFLGRFGDVPTNVGSGGGMQPIAVIKSNESAGQASKRINDAILSMEAGDLADILDMQNKMAMERKFTYLLGPIKTALRPRLLTPGHLEALARYGGRLWNDCLTLEKMWKSGELDELVAIEEEELEIARSQPWQGSAAIIAGDGLFGFGAGPE